MEVIWPKWDKIINRRFVPLVKNKDRYLICWGGRGSSKSDFIAKKLIFRCLSEPYFRYLLVRKNYNTVKNSQFQTIKDIIEDLGLSKLFTFNMTTFEIKCINGNKFIAVGCDDPKKIKSTKDPSGAWYEEDIIDEDDWITITTSIRTSKATYLQEVFTINPEVEGNYEENWFWKRFFEGRVDKSFNSVIYIEIDGQQIPLTYTCHHSTYHDNRWLPDEFKAFLEDMKRTNPYYYTIYTLGEWGNKQTGGRAYKSFDRIRHVANVSYNPDEVLHLSFDFNVKPYLTLTVWQVYVNEATGRKKAIQIDEILGFEPNNRTEAVCRLFTEKYPYHRGGVFIYGDPSGRKEDTRNEKGHNDFRIIVKALSRYNPRTKIADSAPPVVQRINWINAIMAANEGSIEIWINENCKYTILDYTQGKEKADGTKFKETFKDDTGVQCERYHHISDANDYFLTKIFRDDFNKYLRGNKEREYMAGERQNSFQY